MPGGLFIYGHDFDNNKATWDGAHFIATKIDPILEQSIYFSLPFSLIHVYFNVMLINVLISTIAILYVYY